MLMVSLVIIGTGFPPSCRALRTLVRPRVALSVAVPSAVVLDTASQTVQNWRTHNEGRWHHNDQIWIVEVEVTD